MLAVDPVSKLTVYLTYSTACLGYQRTGYLSLGIVRTPDGDEVLRLCRPQGGTLSRTRSIARSWLTVMVDQEPIDDVVEPAICISSVHFLATVKCRFSNCDV